MRAADLARLNEPYPEALEPTEEVARAALGIKLPALGFPRKRDIRRLCGTAALRDRLVGAGSRHEPAES